MVMIMTNIHEIKARLSEYLEAVGRGERVVICKRNTPIAELRAIAPARSEPRKVGGAAGRLTIPESFFQPLPEDVLMDFEGEQPGGRASVSAERRAGSAPRRTPRRKPRGRS
jgi:prevent-host-death family protein